MDNKIYRILVINPGSTSTKVAVYENATELFREEIVHDQAELLKFEQITDQLEMRVQTVRDALARHDFDSTTLDGVVGRGGMIPNLGMGGYAVNQSMRDVITGGTLISHASNLGALMAWKMAEPTGIPAIIYDAVSADSLSDVARVTGMPEIRRESFCHVLNSRAMSRKYAESQGRRYEDMKLLVAHLGGGISISAHQGGEIIDVISDDGGPFSPERAGSLNILYIIDMCFSGKYTKQEVIRKQRGMGGLKALVGTSDVREVEKMIDEGDDWARLCYEAEAYQISKGIGNLAPALCCDVDAVILTGGVAYSERMTGLIKKYVGSLAPVVVMPGENEMLSLALGMLRILKGEEEAKEYVAAERVNA